MSDTTDEADDEKFVRPFADFLTDLRRGAVHEEASQALHDLIAAVEETRKAGRLTITFEVSIQKGTDMLAIKDSVATKTPRLDRPTSLWFVDRHGNATRRDPSQMEIPGMRVVSSADARKANNA
ncbi:hypothetical protein [Nocardia abscessus]|uniref:hypothetical protein n=1 Tax=Nocardia abscessus TaxID=120957 RepID=UPI00245775B6|nr:hypothetical protein [Nocardia abscessus]